MKVQYEIQHLPTGRTWKTVPIDPQENQREMEILHSFATGSIYRQERSGHIISECYTYLHWVMLKDCVFRKLEERKHDHVQVRGTSPAHGT